MWWRRRRSCNAPRVKTDAKDALHLARLLRLGEITPIAVPSLEQEAARIGCCLLALRARRTMLHVWLAASRVGDSVLVVRLLGPVQVVKAGEQVAPGGPRQRAVLALLLLDAGRLVPAERLVEEVWRGKAPPGAVKTLRSYVSRLRSLLAPEANLVARGGGYVMTLDAGRVDIAEFEEQRAAGQAARWNW